MSDFWSYTFCMPAKTSLAPIALLHKLEESCGFSVLRLGIALDPEGMFLEGTDSSALIARWSQRGGSIELADPEDQRIVAFCDLNGCTNKTVNLESVGFGFGARDISPLTSEALTSTFGQLCQNLSPKLAYSTSQIWDEVSGYSDSVKQSLCANRPISMLAWLNYFPTQTISHQQLEFCRKQGGVVKPLSEGWLISFYRCHTEVRFSRLEEINAEWMDSRG